MENKGRNLKKNFIYNFISQVLTLIVPLATTPYLARVLHETGNGQISYVNSLITYFVLFANLGFNVYGQREIAKIRDDKKAKSKLFFEIVIIKAFLSFLSLAVLFTILFTVGYGEKYNILVLCSSFQVIAVIFDILFFYQGEEDFKSIAIRQIIIKALGMAGIFIFVKNESHTWVYMLLFSLITLFSNFIMWPKAIKNIERVKLKELTFKEKIKPTLLIFLPTLAVTVYSVFDKTMIGLFSSNPDFENGCYEQAYKINSVALIFITVISPILIPRNAYDYYNGNIESFKKHINFACNYVFLLGIPLIAGFAVLSNNLSSWFLGAGFESVPLLLIIMSVRFLASGFGVIFGDQIFIAIGKEKFPTISTIIGAVVNVVLNLLLIPKFGAAGAAIATAASEIVVTTVLAAFAIKYKYFSLKQSMIMSWKNVVAVVPMVICIYFLNNYFDYSIWSFIIIAVTGAAIYGIMLLVLRDKFVFELIRKLLNMVKSKLKMRGKKQMSNTKEQIMELVKKYYQENHVKGEYKSGDKITYAARVYDEKELLNLIDSSLEFWLTSGRYCDEFERNMAKYLNIKLPVLLVNSGSSANLLAFMTLTSPQLGERAIKRGDEVITVACGFPTTVTPIINYGAIPVFVDVTIPQYNIDVEMLEKALSPKTKAVMIAHTLGNPFDLKAVKDFCDKHNLWLIEDNCDALGSKYTINGVEKFTGTIGDIGTSSFYPPHHMTMGEGGAVYTTNPVLYKLAKSFRDWGRDCICPSGVDNFCKHRFDGQYGELPKGYDHKYVYSHFGYNLKVTDMQAAVGVAQLEKFPSFVEKRKENWKRLRANLECVSDKLILPEACPNSDPSWFGFLITCKEGISRTELTKYLEDKKIQTRNLFAGNLVKHPCFDEMRRTGEGYRVVGDLSVTDYVMNNTFWIGVYPGMTNEMIDDMASAIKEFLNK